jgi:DivIVA domain-containing protein
VPVVFEKLAAQLHDPLFRTSESGYDPDDVRLFLDSVADRLAVLERRVAKAEAKADRAEHRLAAARRFVRSGARPEADTGVLDDVVRAGRRRAEEVAAAAAEEVQRLKLMAANRVAEARANTSEQDLRAEVDEQRTALRRELERTHVAQAEFEAVDRAVRDGRDEILAGLDQHLRELADMAAPIAKEACQ